MRLPGDFRSAALILLALGAACARNESTNAMPQPPPTPPPSPPSPAPGKTGSGELTVTLAPGPAPGIVLVGLANGADTSVKVFSHVETAQLSLPWYTLELTGTGAARRLYLEAPANEAAAITVELGARQALTHEVDLQAWAQRPHNGGARLASGSYTIVATYSVTEAGDHWTGTISSAPLPVVMP